MSDQVTMDWMGYRVSGDARAQLAPEGSQDLQALEPKVKKVWSRFPAVTEPLCLLVVLITPS